MLKRNFYSDKTKLIIRSDNGPQFRSFYFENTCIKLNIEHGRILYATPNKNAHIESFHRTLEDECLSIYEFEIFADVYKKVSEYMKASNKVRLHSAIGYITPEEYYKGVLDGNEVKQIVK